MGNIKYHLLTFDKWYVRYIKTHNFVLTIFLNLMMI